MKLRDWIVPHQHKLTETEGKECWKNLSSNPCAISIGFIGICYLGTLMRFRCLNNIKKTLIGGGYQPMKMRFHYWRKSKNLVKSSYPFIR